MPAWISADDLRTLLDLDADEPTDERIDALVAIAQAQVSTYVGVTIDATDRSEEIDGYGTDTLEVTYRPVLPGEDDEPDVALTRYGADEPVDPDSYVVDREAGVIRKRSSGSTFARGVAAYTAAYRSGFDPIPQDLVGVVAEAVAFHLNRIATAGLSGETLDQYSYTAGGIETAVSPASRATLDTWRARFLADLQ